MTGGRRRSVAGRPRAAAATARRRTAPRPAPLRALAPSQHADSRARRSPAVRPRPRSRSVHESVSNAFMRPHPDSTCVRLQIALQPHAAADRPKGSAPARAGTSAPGRRPGMRCVRRLIAVVAPIFAGQGAEIERPAADAARDWRSRVVPPVPAGTAARRSRSPDRSVRAERKVSIEPWSPAIALAQIVAEFESGVARARQCAQQRRAQQPDAAAGIENAADRQSDILHGSRRSAAPAHASRRARSPRCGD